MEPLSANRQYVAVSDARLYRTGLTGSTVNATFGTMRDRIAPAGF
jgi:hypothetical protein